jgi:hypothetical protein
MIAGWATNSPSISSFVNNSISLGASTFSSSSLLSSLSSSMGAFLFFPKFLNNFFDNGPLVVAVAAFFTGSGAFDGFG